MKIFNKKQSVTSALNSASAEDIMQRSRAKHEDFVCDFVLQLIYTINGPVGPKYLTMQGWALGPYIH